MVYNSIESNLLLLLLSYTVIDAFFGGLLQKQLMLKDNPHEKNEM